MVQFIFVFCSQLKCCGLLVSTARNEHALSELEQPCFTFTGSARSITCYSRIVQYFQMKSLSAKTLVSSRKKINRIKYSLSPAAREHTRTWLKWQVQYISRKLVRKTLCRVIFCQSVQMLFLSYLIFLWCVLLYLTGEVIKVIFLSITLSESNVKCLRRVWLFKGDCIFLLIVFLFALVVLFILIALAIWSHRILRRQSIS